MKKYVLGIDVGGTNIKIGLVGPSYKVVDRERISTKKFNQTRQKLIQAILKKINDIC
jgi:predicted NBD/HSP70 family sugar kinase